MCVTAVSAPPAVVTSDTLIMVRGGVEPLQVGVGDCAGASLSSAAIK